ncbi:MAG TPA: hypothetical protein VGP72_05280 [Planctomycetota bacterium]|jgi:hypothetical protein
MYRVICEASGEVLSLAFSLEAAAAVALALCRKGIVARVAI